MKLGSNHVARRRELIGVAIAAIILSVIFIPFQNISAFTVTIDLPDADAGVISQSAAGESFEITIDVEAGELISIESVTLIRDNDEISVSVATFDSDGDFVSGDTTLVKDNEISVSTSSNTGYGYGAGLITDGSTFSPPYSYSITTSDDFIGGNTLGYSSAAGGTNFVTGLVGPGAITISGVLRTATLAEGDHTLDVLIDTGAGGNDVDQITGTTFDFEVEEDDSVVVEELDVPVGDDLITLVSTDSDGNEVVVDLVLGTGAVTSGTVIMVVQNVDDFIAANTDEELEDMGLDQIGGDQLIFTTDDDSTEFIAVGFILDIDISALGLPDGTLVTLNMNYDDSELTEELEEDVRLMHQLDTLDEWEVLTNDDEDINEGEEVDTVLNIVYGSSDDFSLFSPAVGVASDDDDGGAGDGAGGGGGGGGRTVYITPETPSGVTTLPDSHFENFPLEKIQIASSAFVNAGGVSITQARVNQQVSVSGEFSNYQKASQTYAFIVQVIDENDQVTDIAWQQGEIESGGTAEISTLWTPRADGTFIVKIFVWDGISVTPQPLSEVTVDEITVT